MIIKRPSDVADFDVVEQIDFATSYRRPRLALQAVFEDQPLSKDILVRLRLARMLAVLRAQGYELKTQT